MKEERDQDRPTGVQKDTRTNIQKRKRSHIMQSYTQTQDICVHTSLQFHCPTVPLPLAFGMPGPWTLLHAHYLPLSPLLFFFV